MAEHLAAEGWVLQPEALHELIDQHGPQVRSVLLDTDLKEVGAKCLPLRQRKSGVLILQVSSIDNIGESRGHDHVGKRMLRAQLTDGHSNVSAIEYKPVSSLSVDIPPGTKVVVKDARVQNGFLLLDEQCIEVLGGHVPVLYEGWEIQRKYSGSARTVLRASKDIHGAPMFRGLKANQRQGENTTNQVDSTEAKGQKKPEPPPSSSTQRVSDARVDALKAAVESNPEVGPAQNHAAAQKLLSRKVEEGRGRGRGRTGRGGRGRHDNEPAVLTLEEWEAKKSGGVQRMHDTHGDEEFARKLQQQLDLGELTEAERIRQSMFNFGGGHDDQSSSSSRGRGRRGRRHHRA